MTATIKLGASTMQPKSLAERIQAESRTKGKSLLERMFHNQNK